MSLLMQSGTLLKIQFSHAFLMLGSHEGNVKTVFPQLSRS